MKIIVTILGLVTVITLAILAQPQRGDRPMLPAQAALDANSDGIISADEITKAAAALRKLDKNADGKLTEEELRPNFNREGRSGPASNGNEELVNTLMSFDENKDGKLSKQEVPERMQGIFARADANHDGMLTRDELTQSVASQNAATNNAGNNAGSERGSGHDEHDNHGERGEGRGGRGGGRGGFGGPGGPRGMLRAMPLLAALDANSDGTITVDEINNAPVALKTLDKNGDGQLTEDELRPAFGPGGRGRGGPGRERPNGERPPTN